MLAEERRELFANLSRSSCSVVTTFRGTMRYTYSAPERSPMLYVDWSTKRTLQFTDSAGKAAETGKGSGYLPGREEDRKLRACSSDG